jgi:hypothetical protein
MPRRGAGKGSPHPIGGTIWQTNGGRRRHVPPHSREPCTVGTARVLLIDRGGEGVATKSSGAIWAVVAVAAVVALALLGGIIESTADLVRLWRTPQPSVIGVATALDAEPLDRMSPPADASLPVVEPSDLAPGQNARPSTLGVPGAADGGRRLSALLEEMPPRGVSNDADVVTDIARDGDDASALSTAAALAQSTRDGSTEAAGQADALAAQPSQSAPQAAPPVRCGWRICESGQQCCNWSCSTCVYPGETCPLLCGAPSVPISARCGPNTCNVTEVCCNPSCGTCVPSGGTCSKEPCAGMYVPVSVMCGMNTCNAGQVCCNPSCGLCTSPGETCSLDPCP